MNDIYTCEIIVSDQDRALTFYVDTLGWEKRDDEQMGDDRWLTVGISGAQTAVSLATPARYDGRQPGGQTGIALTTEDIQRDYERLTAAGVAFTMPPTPMPFGNFGANFDDPDGNNFFLAGPKGQS